MSSFVFSNGAKIPSFGLGTWELRDGTARALVADALALGIRHFDTARLYENERDVGEALLKSTVPREEIFVTTKIPPDMLKADSVLACADAALSELGIGYIDLLLIHWPNPEIPLKETLGAFAVLKRRGVIRHIGVSNFPASLLEEAVAVSVEPIVNNQVEYHPYLQQNEVRESCARLGISLTAYCPLAKGRIADDPTIGAIATAHGKTNAQITLRWLIQQESVIVIPRSSKPKRLKENFSIHDFSLSESEMRRIALLGQPNGRLVSPTGWAPKWD